MKRFLIFSVFLSALCIAFLAHTVSSQRCPTPELIKPCICYRSVYGEDVVECSGLKSHDDIRTIFGRVPGWKFTILYVLDSTMLYFPASVFANSSISQLNVTGSTMISLFDEPPKTNTIEHIFVESCTFQRGFRWDLVSTLKDINSLILQNMPMRALGTTFMNNIPQNTQYLWFEGNELSRLVSQPFEKLKKLEFLILKNQLLNKLKLLKFPKTLRHIDLGWNNLQTLPDGFFSGLPDLALVALNNNKFLTMKEDTLRGIRILFMDDDPLNCNCLMKWIVTNRYHGGVITGTCASPSNLKGKELEDLTESDFIYCG